MVTCCPQMGPDLSFPQFALQTRPTKIATYSTPGQQRLLGRVQIYIITRLSIDSPQVENRDSACMSHLLRRWLRSRSPTPGTCSACGVDDLYRGHGLGPWASAGITLNMGWHWRGCWSPSRYTSGKSCMSVCVCAAVNVEYVTG